MRHVFNCRRTFVAVLGMGLIAAFGFYQPEAIGNLGIHIAAIAGVLAGANAFQARATAPPPG